MNCNTKTKWYQDLTWVLSLLSILLYPIGYVAGILYGGIVKGFDDACRNFAAVSAEYERIRNEKSKN